MQRKTMSAKVKQSVVQQLVKKKSVAVQLSSKTDAPSQARLDQVNSTATSDKNDRENTLPSLEFAEISPEPPPRGPFLCLCKQTPWVLSRGQQRKKKKKLLSITMHPSLPIPIPRPSHSSGASDLVRLFSAHAKGIMNPPDTNQKVRLCNSFETPRGVWYTPKQKHDWKQNEGY